MQNKVSMYFAVAIASFLFCFGIATRDFFSIAFAISLFSAFVVAHLNKKP
jgi:hypothetical protein